MADLRYWIWLTTRGAEPGKYAFRLLETYGDPEQVYYAPSYRRLPGVTEKLREALEDKSLEGAERILAQCRDQGIRILTLADEDYPYRLQEIPDPPPVLYVKGNLPDLDREVPIAVVGARRASLYGLRTAQKLGEDLARGGATVVSGIARGIDGAALSGAIAAGGKVVSVLGCGVDVVYPREHGQLYQDVAAAGALVSEYPPGTQASRHHFPVRNRIVSGLSLGVVVVEGAARSGSLITARRALDQGRDVFALPGNVDAPMSRGPNTLIQEGQAKLIQMAWDVLEGYQFLAPEKIKVPPQRPEFRDAPSPPPKRKGPESQPQWRMFAPAPHQEPELPQEPQRPEQPPQPKLPQVSRGACGEEEWTLLTLLAEKGPLTPDELQEETGLASRSIASLLTMLQIKKLVREADQRFSTCVELEKEF